jgi:hypothetical protein
MRLKTQAEAVRATEREVRTAIAANEYSSIVAKVEGYRQALQDYTAAVLLAFTLPGDGAGNH